MFIDQNTEIENLAIVNCRFCKISALKGNRTVPLPLKTYYGYDKVGNKTLEGVKVSNTSNRIVKYEYDHKNRAVKSAMGNQVTRNEYDGVGNITKVIQVNLTGEDQITNYTYDRRNLLTKYTDAMGQKVSQE